MPKRGQRYGGAAAILQRLKEAQLAYAVGRTWDIMLIEASFQHHDCVADLRQCQST